MLSPKRRAACLMATILALVILGVVAQEEGSLKTETRLGAPPVEEEATPPVQEWSWDAWIPVLRDMNTKLETLITEYERGDISYLQLRDRVTSAYTRRDDALLDQKRELINSLPDIGGVSFYDLYHHLRSLDDLLVDAVAQPGTTKEMRLSFLRMAKTEKEKLEQLITEAATSTQTPEPGTP